MKQIAVYGAGSYAQEVACLIKKINTAQDANVESWDFIGYFDDEVSLWGHELLHGSVLGGIQRLNNYPHKLSLVIGIANVSAIRAIISKIENFNIDYPNIVDPDTSFTNYESVIIGKGNVIGEGCRIGPNVRIGDYNIVVNDSVFGHDVSVRDFNVFYPAVRLSGKVNVDSFNTFGVRTTILPGLSVSSRNKFAPGCIMYTDAESGFIYSGNPARKISHNQI